MVRVFANQTQISCFVRQLPQPLEKKRVPEEIICDPPAECPYKGGGSTHTAKDRGEGRGDQDSDESDPIHLPGR
jgi:hypothetical protein